MKLNGITIIPLKQFLEYGYEAENLVQEAEEFGLGAKTRTLGDQELQNYLHKVENKTKSKADVYNLPFVHSGTAISIKDEHGKNYNLDSLRKLITTRPVTFLKSNKKMQHSDRENSIFYNIGLPALKGLAVNEKTGEFLVVDTCPGAGMCKVYCYAKHGQYILFKMTSINQTQMLNFLMNDPEGFFTRLSRELEQRLRIHKGNQLFVRWHDSGDFFSSQYLNVAYAIARKFPQIKFYAYTKVSDVALGKKPKNFLISFSEGALPKEQEKVNLVQIKHSSVVPHQMFWDLVIHDKSNHFIKDENGKVQWKSPEALQEMKRRISKKWHVNIHNILTYSELLKIPEGNRYKWNVIVVPGDGDTSSARHDVIGTYLLEH
ncbi:Gene 88 protein [uncultured archaeon]|nr:Gene 88 protein [uncultured archaeon]